MDYKQLSLFISENNTIDHYSVNEWILQKAKECKIEEALIFRSIESFEKNKKIHKTEFFEIGQTLLQILIIGKEDSIKKLIEITRKEKISFFYSITDIQFEKIQNN